MRSIVATATGPTSDSLVVKPGQKGRLSFASAGAFIVTLQELAGDRTSWDDSYDSNGVVTVDSANGFTGWVLAAIASAFSVLSGIIAMFFKKQVDSYETQIKELKEHSLKLEARADLCESEREAIRIEHAVLKTQHTMLEKRVSSLEVNKKNRDSIG